MIQLKSIDDIKRIRDSGRILAATHKLLKDMISPGITTRELDIAAHDFITGKGAIPSFLNYQGYPASICISVNEQVIHGIPGKYRLKKGDIVSIDIGVTFKGYISDSAATYGVGNISPKAQTLLTVTKECLDKAIKAAVCGNRVRDISQAVYSHAKSYEYGVVREYCGHGTGFELHEEPQIPNYPGKGVNTRLRPGMVIAIEPMINAGTDDIFILDDNWTVVTADNSFSAHFEHTVAVLEDRTEILTAE